MAAMEVSEVVEHFQWLTKEQSSDPGEVSVTATLRAAYKEVVAGGANE